MNVFNALFSDFTVVGLRKPEIYYLFMIEFASNSHPESYTDYLNDLDLSLKEANMTYRYFRDDIGILKAPKLWVLKSGSFNEVLSERIKMGAPREQTKIPHLTDDVKIKRDFEDKIFQEVSI